MMEYKSITLIYVFFSEDTKHDVPMVKVIVDKIMKYIIENLKNVNHCEFFTDGCGGQYKNAEVFKYLCEIKANYEIEAKWNFFATSHGKSPCDGI